MIVHPEALDPESWRNGEILFVDPDGEYIMATAWRVSSLIVFNGEFVDGSELETTERLLASDLRGRISTDDPTTPGTGMETALTFLELAGEDFVRELYVDQEPVISDDRRQIYDWLARGTPPVTLSVVEEELIKLLDEGFDIRTTWPADLPQAASVGGGHIVALDQGPNPNATKLFLNWLLTREAQELYSQALGRTSMRLDVGAPEGVPDYLVPKPDVEYFNADGWDFRVVRYEEQRELIREIVGRG